MLELPATHKEYYGDETRWFIGTVKDINDPLELGRIKVRIFGVHSENTADISDGDLPWAQIAVPVTEGGSSGIGATTGIKPQAQVFGVFLDGKNSQLPLVLGSIPKFERPIDGSALTDYASFPDELQHNDLVNSTRSQKNRLPPSEVDRRYLFGADNIEKAFNFFLTQEGAGLTAEQASGVIGNFFVESDANGNNGDLNPLAINESEGSFGIAQWNPAESAGSRFQGLKTFSAEKNLPHQSLYAQLLWTVREFNTTEKRAFKNLTKTETVREATIVIEKQYERPQPGSTDVRVEAAEETFRRLG